MVSQYGYVDQSRCREWRHGMPDKESRFVGESSATPGPPDCPDEEKYPWRCDGPSASDCEWRPGQTLRLGVPCETHLKRNAGSCKLRRCSSLDRRQNE